MILNRLLSQQVASRRPQSPVDLVLAASDAPRKSRKPSPAPTLLQADKSSYKRPKMSQNYIKPVTSSSSIPRCLDLQTPNARMFPFTLQSSFDKEYVTFGQETCEFLVPKLEDSAVSNSEEVLIKLEEGEAVETGQDFLEQGNVIAFNSTEQDTTFHITSYLDPSVVSSVTRSTSAHYLVTSADVHVFGNEEMANAATEHNVVSSLPESDFFMGGSDEDSEDKTSDDFEQHIASTQEEIQGDLPGDEELPHEVAALVRLMEAVMDADHEKLLSGNDTFDWQEDFSAFSSVQEKFLVHPTGPVKPYDSPYDAFIDIFDETIMKEIAKETNRYAQQLIDKEKAKGTFTKDKRMYRWKDTTVDELYRLFAIFIYMDICQRTDLTEYWKKDPVLGMPGFSKLISYDRYILLNKCLRFSNKEKQPVKSAGSLPHMLYELYPIISHLNDKFQSLYVLNRYISIDESLTLFKGRLSFMQYIKTKGTRWGIKSFELCESRTGYLYKFIIYTGKDTGGRDEANNDLGAEDGGRGRRGRGRGRVKGCGRGRGRGRTRPNDPDEGSPADASGDVSAVNLMRTASALAGKTTQIVLSLLEGLERKGYCVTMDNFFNSPALARYLKFRGFDCLGTVRRTRKNVPLDVQTVTDKSERGTIVARHSGDVMVLSWKDSKVVSMISTYHDGTTYVGRPAGAPHRKPVCVNDYNLTMGGVDLKNQRLSMYFMERKTSMKWYVKLFKRLLNMSMHNAFIMFRHGEMAGTTTGMGQNVRLTTHRQVRYQLAQELVKRHPLALPAPRVLGTDPFLRLDTTRQHMAVRNTKRRCYMCTLRGKQGYSSIMCNVCGIGLCVLAHNCFYEYHTLETIERQAIPRPRKRPQQYRHTEPKPSTSDA